MATTTVIALPGIAPVGAFQGRFSGTIQASTTDGTFTIDVRDLNFALQQGYVSVQKESRVFVPMGAPAAASVAAIVASVALTNTTLTVAAQPDQLRQVFMRVDPGTLAITAGVCTITYSANDGTAAQVDVLSLVTALSTVLSTNLTKGCSVFASAVVSGLVGGASPHIQFGTNAALAVPVSPNSVDVTILKEVTDDADTGGTAGATLGTLTTAGIWTPHTAPNATHVYGIHYTTVAPA